MEEKIVVGDLVTRESYHHDIVFKVVDIDDKKVARLKGIVMRLEADSPLSDLRRYVKEDPNKQQTEKLEPEVNKVKKITRRHF